MQLTLSALIAILVGAIAVVTPLLPLLSNIIGVNVRYFDDLVMVFFIFLAGWFRAVRKATYLEKYVALFMAFFFISYFVNGTESNILALLSQFRNYFLPIICFYMALYAYQSENGFKIIRILYIYHIYIIRII